MDYEHWCRLLGLSRTPDGVWFGEVDRHIVALFGKDLARGHGEKVRVEGAVGAEFATPTLTIQVSHADPAPKHINSSDVNCGRRVSQLVQSDEARCTIEPHRSLLFIFDARFIDSYDVLSEVVRGFLSGLEAAGVPLRGKRCHWCGLRDVPDCSFIEGRATRMCDICIQERRTRIAATRPFTGFGGVTAIIGAALAVPVSAISAAALQISWHSLIFWWGNGRGGHVHVPNLVLMILIVGYGVVVAAPIAIALRWIRTRGDRFAVGLAFVACIIAAVLAEVAVVAWFAGYESDWPFWEFAGFALRISWENAGFNTLVRVFLAAVAGITAAILARPKPVPFFD